MLAGIIGHTFPQYWMDASNLQRRIDEILASTAGEKLPWL